MNWWKSALAVAWTVAVLASPMAHALEPFHGEYEVFQDGDRIGTARLKLLAVTPGRWIFTTVSEGEGGMAGFLGARIEESSTLVEQDGQLGTRDYHYKQEVAWRDRERSLKVDLATGAVEESDRKRRWNYRTKGPVLDRHALVLAVSQDLARAGQAQAHAVAHKGEITQWTFEQGAPESVTTEAGQFKAVRLERIRENSERRTISWHAPQFDWLPVVIEHVEPDGKTFRMALKRWIQPPASPAGAP